MFSDFDVALKIIKLIDAIGKERFGNAKKLVEICLQVVYK